MRSIIKYHPFEQKLSAFIFYINRVITLQITEQAKQQEWNTILKIAKNNGLSLHSIYNLRNKLIIKTQHVFSTQTQQKKNCITFTYHSTLIYNVINLFKHNNLNIAFRATNITT